jgi:hypothetical protein
MVLVRETRRIVDLEQCGINPTKLFAVYDQIHTTGTDLPFLSTFNARAVQTLGKDMVWRDYVQGAWRMRRLGCGHSIHLFIIPEVHELITRELGLAQLGLSVELQSSTETDILRGVAAWLVINAMRLEKVQFQQLLLQNTSNVWRKQAFSILLKSSRRDLGITFSSPNSEPVTAQGDLVSFYSALSCFSEEVGFSVDESIVPARALTTIIGDMAAAHSELIITKEDQKVVEYLKGLSHQVESSEGKVTLEIVPPPFSHIHIFYSFQSFMI